MIWKNSDNKWMSKWIDKAVKFSNELDSAACHFSREDKDAIKECMVRLNEISNRIVSNESYS